MANRDTKPITHLQTGVVDLDGYVTLSNVGTVVSSTFPGAGSFNSAGASVTAAVVRTAAGTYTIKLSDPYYRVLAKQASMEVLSTLAPLAVQWRTASVGVTGASNTIQFVLVNSSGTPTDPTVGCGIWISLRLKNSSVAV